MAKILINENKTVDGHITISRVAIKDKIAIEGEFVTHEYIEVISQIESHRYKINGVNVTSEDFASNDFHILYKFTAENIEIKYNKLNNELYKSIAKEIYEKEDSALWEEKKGGDK